MLGDLKDKSNHSLLMSDLSAKLDICRPLLSGKIVYIDYPVHWNVGDLLIWQGARKFLKRHGLKVTGEYSINNLAQGAIHAMETCSTICLHGGGNLGDLWPQYQKNRERIITSYPNKRIVMFPQTLHYDNFSALEKSCQIFRNHRDLHIFVRDRHSLSVLESQGVRNVALCPDMAHALWGTYPNVQGNATEPLYLVRQDKEVGALTPRTDHTNDWQDLLTGVAARFYKFGMRIDEADGGKGQNHLPALAIWNEVSKLLINKAVKLFQPHETIITNRLHAMLLSMLLGKQCVAYDNSYGKLSSYRDCWLKELPFLTLESEAYNSGM